MSDVDERKRPISDSNDGEPSKKRKALNELSEEGPLTQSDVVYFQKEAIWRQMTAYKHKSQQLSIDLRKLEKLYSENEEKINILDAWYGQIVTLFSSSSADSDGTGDDLLIVLPDSSDELTKVLEKRRKQLVEILEPLIENLKSSTNSTEASQVIIKLETLTKQLGLVKAENVKLSKAKQALTEKVEELSEKISQLCKEKERLNSKTLKRVDESIKKEESVKEEPETQVPVKSDTTTEASTTTKDETSDNVVNEEIQAKLDSYEKLEIEVETLKSTISVLQEQVTSINAKYETSEQEKLAISNKLDDLKESDLEGNVHYSNLIKNNRSLQDQIAKLTKINEANIAKLKLWEEKSSSIEHLLNDEIKAENEKLKESLHKAETDLIRIRSVRDELMSKNSILKSQLDDGKLNDNLVKLNTILNKRLEQIQNEASGEPSAADESASKEELVAKVTLLSAEIKEIEEAFKETREISLKKLSSAVDQESMVKKLSVEKTKADQKYFAAMRLKDAMQSEIKLLKAQVSKSQDLIKNFSELEKNYTSKIDLLTKSVGDYKAIKDTSVQETTQLQDTIKSLKNKLEIMDNDFKKSRHSIETKVKTIVSLEAQVNSNQVTINKLEKTLKSTESLLKKYKTNNTSSIHQEDEQQLEALRSIAKCSVCTKNWKDTAITVCGHVFCSSCTQERLAARLRRCPSCNKGFSANDLLSVHL